MQKNKSIKNYRIAEKFSSATSNLSGITSFLGGYQVCHNICIGIIALLSIIGITVVGMPLFFLTKVAVPFWIAAVVLFAISLTLYLKKKCISKNLLTFNVGLLIAGIPFSNIQKSAPVFWVIGGAVVVFSLLSYAKAKLSI